MKLWEKGQKLDKIAEGFAVGNSYIYDAKLLKYDCIASIAHAKMLGKIGILTAAEVKTLVKGLEEIIELDGKGKFTISKEQEDSHTAIENYLTEKYGDVGMKIHTARSRNDQVLTALRLYEKAHMTMVLVDLASLKKSLQAFKSKYGNIAMPGYTHTRKAMPSSMGMWAEAFIESIEDDAKLLHTTMRLLDQSPLGTGAGYGLPMKVDREFTAKELGFSRVQKNPIYAQNSKGKLEAVAIASLSSVMLGINKMATDLIMFSMPEFGYFVLPEEFSTGSSIMPHKKNPDVLEVARANYHIVCGYWSTVSGICGNLISGYSTDVALVKAPTLWSFETTENTVKVMAAFIAKLKVDKDACKAAMSEELYSVDKAYKMVKGGVPFRKAYKEVAKKYK